MDIDFSKLSLVELTEILAKATEARKKMISARRAELLAQIEQLDRMEGATPSKPTTFPSKRLTSRGINKLKIYRDDSGNYWRAAGKRPKWLQDRLDQGAKLEDFLVVDNTDLTTLKK